MWDLLIVNPMTNILLLLYDWLGNNLILSISVFTILTRVLMLPLNIRQQQSMMRTQEMQPQIKKIQKKYRDNPQKMQEEFKKIGYNPTDTLSGCLPLLLTFPIFIGLFQVLRLVLSTTPQGLFELTQRVWPGVIDLSSLLPIDNQFLWMNLGQPDPYFVMPVLVFVTMFAQQKLLSPARNNNDKDKSGNKKQEDDPGAAMTQSMQYTMPIMFGFFALTFQSGLSIYFVVSNIVGILQGYYTRNLMAAQKEQEKKVGEFNISSTDEVEESSKVNRRAARHNGAAKKKKSRSKKSSTSKRKRRSAKR